MLCPSFQSGCCYGRDRSERENREWERVVSPSWGRAGRVSEIETSKSESDESLWYTNICIKYEVLSPEGFYSFGSSFWHTNIYIKYEFYEIMWLSFFKVWLNNSVWLCVHIYNVKCVDTRVNNRCYYQTKRNYVTLTTTRI